MFSPDLLPLLRCPSDRSPLEWADSGAVCALCGTSYPLRDGYLEILPREDFAHTTQYDEEEGGAILDYREVGLPLLSAKIKNDLLNDFLRFQPRDTVLDLGCGNGKFAYWNYTRVATLLALDRAPWFSDPARVSLPLLRGDVRSLPFDDATFDKVYSIDVLEHLTANDIDRVLGEAHRTLRPGGRLFIFSNTREPQTLSWAIAPQRAVTGWLKRRGVVDFRRDEWRKSDHVKALETFEDLQRVLGSHGFGLVRVAFWNGLFQGWVENVVVKLGESALSRKESGQDAMARQVTARREVRRTLASSRRARYYAPLAALTALMRLDIRLFGHLRAGPYFVLAEKQ